jgi:hypothetical protein
MFNLKEINQMERELCAHLQWNLNIQGEELSDFSARVRFQRGSQTTVSASSPSLDPIVAVVEACTVLKNTPDRPQPSRQRLVSYDSQPRQVVQSQTQMTLSYPLGSLSYGPSTTAHSSQPLQFTSASSSLLTSPASYCKTPPPAPVTPASCRSTRKMDVCHSFDNKQDIMSPKRIPAFSSSAGVGEELSESTYGQDNII